MPAGTVPAAFNAFHCVLHVFMNEAEPVVEAGCTAAGVVDGCVATAATGVFVAAFAWAKNAPDDIKSTAQVVAIREVLNICRVLFH